MTYYITTPLYYVNDLPHIGSAYPTIAADFFAGHQVQRGEDVCFLTGLDEHGQKIEKAAAQQGRSPREHCDYIASEFKKLWELLEIDYDHLRRTSDEDHKAFVMEFFKKVQAAGDIYKAEYKGLYCVSCEDFKLEKDLEEGQICPVHKQKVEEYAQENYFFKLSKYEAWLEEHISKHPDFIYPENRRNEVLGWIKEGLRDFPISRCNISWGIDVPGDTSGQKVYVWFDALLGYMSGLGSKLDHYWVSASGDASQQANQTACITHIIGKDILRFHAVYWPAMLKSAAYALPTQVFGHGFLTKDGMKMGKTLGNVIDPVALVNTYGSDAVRFYFMREIIFGRDGDFTQDGFVTRLNADLANNLGNLLNRSLNLINKYLDGTVPNLRELLESTDYAEHFAVTEFDGQKKEVYMPEFQGHISRLLECLNESGNNYQKEMDKLNPHQALHELFATLNDVNGLLSLYQPWKILKQDPNNKIAALSLAISVEACRRAAILLAPLTPNLSVKIFQQLGLLGAEVKASRRELLRTVFRFDEFSLANADNSGSKTASGRKYNIPTELSPVFLRLELATTA